MTYPIVLGPIQYHTDYEALPFYARTTGYSVRLSSQLGQEDQQYLTVKQASYTSY